MAKQQHSKPSPIRAAAYLRKSTAGSDGNGGERQEKSIPQQTAEVAKLMPTDGGKYNVIRTYADPGKSGWKRGAARPDFARLLADCQRQKDVQAVLVDDLDRFSRADVDEVWTDIGALRQAGVKYIHSVCQGCFKIDDPTDIGTIIRITVEAWGANGYSRKLGRRIALARRNAAKEGRRSGGTIPYGLASDGNGGLQPGEADKVAALKHIYADFVGGASLNSIARALNKHGIPGPRGGAWYVATIKELLKHAEYKGEFAFGDKANGQFYSVGADGEVRPASDDGPNGKAVFTHAARWEAIIEPALWEKAQRRLASFGGGKRKPRSNGYPLAGILVCDNCGSKMYGCSREDGTVTYRCNAAKGVCRGYEIREDALLPGLLAMLAEEVDSVLAAAVLPRPPQPLPGVDDNRKADTLRRQIATAEDRILDVADKRTRQSLDAKITAMRDELDGLLAEQDAPDLQGAADAAAQLRDWWADTQRRLLPAVVDAGSPLAKQAFPDMAATAAEPAPWHDWVTALTGERPAAVFIAALDKRAVNETFVALEAEVRLRFRSERRAKRYRHYFDRGRFRLGQCNGAVSGFVGSSSEARAFLMFARTLLCRAFLGRVEQERARARNAVQCSGKPFGGGVTHAIDDSGDLVVLGQRRHGRRRRLHRRPPAVGRVVAPA